MGQLNEASLFADDDALQWARAFAEFDNVELVSDQPWARTHRLVHDAKAAYLKVVPARQTAVMAPVLALAQCFPGRMPQVLAHDAARGWLLTADHGGRTLDYGASDDDFLAVVTTYARLQAEAAAMPALLTGLPQPDIGGLPQRLLDFLRPAVESGPGVVQADYFLGAELSATYHQLLSRRMDLLIAHLQAAAGLPATVNHGDLRPPNTAIASNGDCVIFDWDDAIAGPAGMSLHGLFNGCVVPSILLSGSAAAQAAADTPNGRLVHAYVDTLAQAGYASAAALRASLPSAACAGVMQFLLNFAAFPGEKNRKDIADTLTLRLDDLLDLCDVLTTRQPALALDLAFDYEAMGEDRRAQYLFQDHLLRHPDATAVALRLCAVLCRRGEREQAEDTYREALARMPDNAALHAGLARVLMQRLALDEAHTHLDRAVALHCSTDDSAEVLSTRTRLHDLQGMQAHAAVPANMPLLRYSDADRAAGEVPPEMEALGAALFEQYGTLQIDNAFAPEDIAQLHDLFMERYEAYFREDDHPDALRLGDKRYMLTVDFDGALGQPGVVGAPMVLPLIRKLLGDECVLGAYTAVISLPGSADQRLHKDHPALFPDTEWHHSLPCFAAQIIIPLVPLNEMTGTTRFYKGTHRQATDEAEAMGAQDPLLPLGSCLLNDYRCAHRGVGNQSDQVRPILTLIFNRPWFRDFRNYAQQPSLRITEDDYSAMPADLQRLVAWWMEERRNDALVRSVLRR